MTTYQNRRGMTFSQAEGLVALPSQLKLRELSKEVRALLWSVVHDSLIASKDEGYSSYGSVNLVGGAWDYILYDYWVKIRHQAADEYNNSLSDWISYIKGLIFNGNYNIVFDFIQYVLQHSHFPGGLSGSVGTALKEGRAAYRLVDGDLIVPIASEEEAQALSGALEDTTQSEFRGARAHLRMAIAALNNSDFSGSIRESIHAVEAVARSLAPDASELGPALAALEKRGHIHAAMKQGFVKLYGYTSDEKGVRHALIDDDQSKVTEVDAIYMLGSCSSFVSYLIGRSREFGLKSA